ncbi:predicted protein [Chaetoceros tenuissimus]|uniref:Uncharacterized protein n=1 Tax=Chaetoceros tenuissimus TaxID=426638 RepID=A0AAD3H2C0_9STRA|nr:predicted protein [Chaetoceros tenuissimus]
MEGQANEIMNFPEDRPSKLLLVASGRDFNHPNYASHNPTYREVLRVSAPVENGQLVFKVYHFNNHDRNSQEWELIEYPEEEADGVVGFINAFLSKEFPGQGVRSEIIETVNTESGRKIGWTHLVKRHDMQSDRRMQIRDVVKSLLGR